MTTWRIAWKLTCRLQSATRAAAKQRGCQCPMLLLWSNEGRKGRKGRKLRQIATSCTLSLSPSRLPLFSRASFTVHVPKCSASPLCMQQQQQQQRGSEEDSCPVSFPLQMYDVRHVVNRPTRAHPLHGGGRKLALTPYLVT